jgi:hypothetical protein
MIVAALIVATLVLTLIVTAGSRRCLRIAVVSLEGHVHRDGRRGGEHVAAIVDQLHDDLVLSRNLDALSELSFELP